MFEKILKRLCPCYFKRKVETDSHACPTVPNITCDTTPTRQTLRRPSSVCSKIGKSGFGITSINTTATTATTATTTTTSSTQGHWKGTFNVIHPQPIYAFPMDSKKSAKKQRKNLLKPPLYWKKATKCLHSVGPPVYQESRNETISCPNHKLKKQKSFRGNHLKHSETIADISSLSSSSTVEVRWLKSQSFDNVFFKSKKTIDFKKDKKKLKHGRENCIKMCSQVFPDISQGVIMFTAAYFNKKKTCMINIDRLENLSKKGREGNAYYSVIKMGILPSEKYLKCTKVLANCSCPKVKQDFSFSVKELTGKVLRFSVFDASLQKQHESVGHALLNLEDIICNQPKKYRIKLYKRSRPHVCPGDLNLSLKYIEVADKFTITIDSARNLNLQKDKNVKLNTYVKVTLYLFGEKVKTKKSVVVLDSRDPSYNSIFTFQVRKDQIDYLSVTITVRLKGFVSDLTIGRLNFGPFFYINNQSLTPWGRVFLRKEFISRWFRMYL